METQTETTSTSGGGGDEISSIKDIRQNLETRIETRHKEHEELLTSLQTIVPDLYSSLNLSLQVISCFNGRPFSPLSPPVNPNPPSTNNVLSLPHLKKPLPSTPHSKPLPSSKKRDITRRQAGSPLTVVRSMVALCLLERIPFEPIDSSTLLRKIENHHSITAADKSALLDLGGESGSIAAVNSALKSLVGDNIGVDVVDSEVGGKPRVMVMEIDRTLLLKELPDSPSTQKLKFLQQPESARRAAAAISEAGDGSASPFGPVKQEIWDPHMPPMFSMMGPRGGPGARGMGMMGMGVLPQHRQQYGKQKAEEEQEEVIKDVKALLDKKSYKESQKSKIGEEISNILGRLTHRQIVTAAQFKNKGGSQLKEYCLALTKEDCRSKTGLYVACDKVHFRRIISAHTDINLGDCSFLDTCRHMKTCKYVHYELDSIPDVLPTMMGTVAPPRPLKPLRPEYCSEVELGESQWINCDIRNFRMDILGQFGVIMADPPWDIHMELPYGTMADDEMRTLNVPALQTDGLIFLWVTGRAMELGRECLELWGYKRVEEIIWVKTNQLQRIIRTGRTGHWLNHSKEHCLVGIKGDPIVNRNIDTDVIVAEVRETSRKPDEMYPLLERISPRTRKLELFARMHNTHAGWLSLGNQLSGAYLVDEGLRARFKAAYPDVEVQPPSPPRSSAMEADPSMDEARNPFSGVETKCAPPLQVTLPAGEAA